MLITTYYLLDFYSESNKLPKKSKQEPYVIKCLFYKDPSSGSNMKRIGIENQWWPYLG